MKKFALIASIIAPMAFMGCQQWVSDGVVEMDKLISLDSLWENAEQYIGKRVTIELDSNLSGGLGGTAPIHSKSYNSIDFLTHPDSMGSTLDSIYAYLLARGIDTSVADTVYLGNNYAISFIADARMGDTLNKPHWIDYNGKILNFSKSLDKKTREKCRCSALSVLIEKSPQKYITGFLMLKDSSDHHTFPDTKTTEVERQLVIAPTGYKYLR